MSFRTELFKSDNDTYESKKALRTGVIITGSVVIGASLVFGYIIPFFHHKPIEQNSTAASGFPLNLELVSSNGQGIDGFRIMYEVRSTIK